jgi:hypothetical protein
VKIDHLEKQARTITRRRHRSRHFGSPAVFIIRRGLRNEPRTNRCVGKPLLVAAYNTRSVSLYYLMITVMYLPRSVPTKSWWTTTINEGFSATHWTAFECRIHTAIVYAMVYSFFFQYSSTGSTAMALMTKKVSLSLVGSKLRRVFLSSHFFRPALNKVSYCDAEWSRKLVTCSQVFSVPTRLLCGRYCQRADSLSRTKRLVDTESPSMHVILPSRTLVDTKPIHR